MLLLELAVAVTPVTWPGGSTAAARVKAMISRSPSDRAVSSACASASMLKAAKLPPWLPKDADCPVPAEVWTLRGCLKRV